MTTSVSVGDCVAPGGSAAGLGDKGPDAAPLPPGAGDAYELLGGRPRFFFTTGSDTRLLVSLPSPSLSPSLSSESESKDPSLSSSV